AAHPGGGGPRPGQPDHRRRGRRPVDRHPPDPSVRPGDQREPDPGGVAGQRRSPGGVMRFVFTPPAETASGLLDLPWAEPLEEWDDSRLIELRHRGLSRHVVRFVSENGVVYALKELDERLARKEYRLLRRLR